MTKLFDIYADYYDLFYAEKNYPAECDYLERLWTIFSPNPVFHVLDLGCGTGRHSVELAKRGYRIVGVDRSEKMIQYARERARQSEQTIIFVNEDIATYKSSERFDSIVAMFAVMGYLTTNEQLAAALDRIRDNLKSNGLFIFDIWYGPTVLCQRPEPRLKIANNGNERLYRFAAPTLNDEQNVVTVDYHLVSTNTDQVTREIHRMRYFFLPELKLLAIQHRFRFLEALAFLSESKPPTCEDWNIVCIFKAT